MSVKVTVAGAEVGVDDMSFGGKRRRGEAMNGSCAVRGGVEAMCAVVSREDHGAFGVERLSEGWAARRTRQRVTWGS